MGGLFTAEGQSIKTEQEILHLLEALWGPRQVSVEQYPKHQQGQSTEAIQNCKENQVAGKASQRPLTPAMLLLPALTLLETPAYSVEDGDFFQSLTNGSTKKGW